MRRENIAYDWFDAHSTSESLAENTTTSEHAPSSSSRVADASRNAPLSSKPGTSTSSSGTLSQTRLEPFTQLGSPSSLQDSDTASGIRPKHRDLGDRSKGHKTRQDGYSEPYEHTSSKSSKYASSSHTTTRGAVTKPKHHGLGGKFLEHRKKEESYQQQDGYLPYTDYWDSQQTRGMGEYSEINVTSFTYHTESHSTSHSRSQFRHIPKQTKKRPFSNLFR